MSCLKIIPTLPKKYSGKEIVCLLLFFNNFNEIFECVNIKFFIFHKILKYFLLPFKNE